MWDGQIRGETHIQQGTPQGSHLSPVMWLVQISLVLHDADRRIQDITRSQLRTRPRRHPLEVQVRVDLMSYVDDVNPLIVTTGSHRLHRRIKHWVDTALNEAAAAEGLTWDAAKETDLDIQEAGASPITSLGITVDKDRYFTEHIKRRTAKAHAVALAMYQLQTSHKGIAPIASRSLYTGMIRPILTYGCELYMNTNTPHISDMLRLEYQVLRRISGAFHGSSHEKLGVITAIEPLEVFLQDRAAAWAARAVRTGNKAFRQLLELPPRPGSNTWHDGSRLFAGNSPPEPPIVRAFRLTAAPTHQALSFGDMEDTEPVPLPDMQIIPHDHIDSEYAAVWAARIGTHLDEGWRTAYSDGSGCRAYNATASHTTSRRAEEEAVSRS